MEQSLSFLGMPVYPFGLHITMGAVLMLVLMGLLATKRKLPEGTVRVFGVLAIPLSIVFSRLFYCLMNIPFFIGTYENPALMLRFFDGGLSISGMLLGLLIALFLTARIRKAPLGDLADVFAVSLSALLCLIYLGQRYTELGVGKIVEENWITSTLPFLFITNKLGNTMEYRMAVFMYQAIFTGVLLLIMVCLFYKKQGEKAWKPGDLALLFFSLYGGGEILLESLRDDGHMLLIFLRVTQLVAVLMPVIAAVILGKRYLSNGGKGFVLALLWLLVVICIGAGILLEFALDGRLVTGGISKVYLYLIMLLVCIGVCFVPCTMLAKANKNQVMEIEQ